MIITHRSRSVSSGLEELLSITTTRPEGVLARKRKKLSLVLQHGILLCYISKSKHKNSLEIKLGVSFELCLKWKSVQSKSLNYCKPSASTLMPTSVHAWTQLKGKRKESTMTNREREGSDQGKGGLYKNYKFLCSLQKSPRSGLTFHYKTKRGLQPSWQIKGLLLFVSICVFWSKIISAFMGINSGQK